MHWTSFVKVLRHRARCNPDLPVYNFITHADSAIRTITCRTLEKRARQIAAVLARQVKPGERALLLYPPGIDYITAFFGCLVAGVTAVPAYPVEPAQRERTLPRLIGIAKDCEPKVVLTLSGGRQTMRCLADSSLATLPWIATDHLSDEVSSPQVATIDRGAPVYVQYTSGSTGAPKGVMISHQNLLHNSAVIERRFEHTVASRGVIWLPPYHDMGLIGGILQPLYAGFPVFLMSYVDFLKHPLRWLRAISHYRATTSGGPNFAYELLASMRITAADFDRLDLRSWDVAFTGAEPVRAKTLRAFARRFAPCGFREEAFYPCYGLAEHTLFVSGGRKARRPVVAAVDAETGAFVPEEAVRVDASETAATVQQAVGCGNADDDSEVLIVDPARREPCSDGDVGEIWVRGPSVAMGYWSNRDLTARIFHARLAHSSQRYLRTGDCGFKLDAELFITGRLKDMMVIRGANHFPQDVEATLEDLRADVFRPGGCAVFAIEDEAAHVVVVRELRARFVGQFRHAETSRIDAPHGPFAAELFRDTRRVVGQRHGIAVAAIVFVPPATIPKTTSGKIQRHLCRSLFTDAVLPVVVEWRAPGLVVPRVAVAPDVSVRHPGIGQMAPLDCADTTADLLED